MATALGFTHQGYLDVPVTKPATEFFDGRLIQKMSPLGRHVLLQAALTTRVWLWDASRHLGRAGPEWDYDLVLADGSVARVVPDVAYLSYERVPRDAPDAAQVPRVAPSVAFEILSPNDPNRPNVKRKMALYREAGANAIVIVDERTRSITLEEGQARRTYREGDVLEIAAMPGFRLDIAEYFCETEL